MKTTFTEYLMEQCMNDTHALDDDLPDMFNSWLMDKDPMEMIDYADKWYASLQPKLEEVTTGGQLKKVEFNRLTYKSREIKEMKYYKRVLRTFKNSLLKNTGTLPIKRVSELSK